MTNYLRRRMCRHMNAIILGLFLWLGVVFLGIIVMKERSNARQIANLKHEAIRKDSIIDEQNESLQEALVLVTERLDSLEYRYVTDSAAWQQERVQLTGNLQEQKRTVQAVTRAYERNKALQTRKIQVDKLPSVSEDEWDDVRGGRDPRRRVYDLSPVLGDSTDQR